MGRGRAKAKQTKVARDLKYNSPNTDLSALQAELAGSTSFIPVADDQFASDDFTENDPYAKYYDADDEDSADEDSADEDSADEDNADEDNADEDSDSTDATGDGAGSSD